MTEQSPTPFNATALDGANADYIGQLAAKHAADPASVDAAWAEFFKSMGDSEADARRAANGPSWARKDWPPQPVDDLTAALTGEWRVSVFPMAISLKCLSIRPLTNARPATPRAFMPRP